MTSLYIYIVQQKLVVDLYTRLV